MQRLAELEQEKELRESNQDHDDDPEHHRSVRTDRKDDSCNVEIEKIWRSGRTGFRNPYHTDIMERFNGIDLDAAGKSCRKRFLLSDGRYRAPSFCSDFLCA